MKLKNAGLAKNDFAEAERRLRGGEVFYSRVTRGRIYYDASFLPGQSPYRYNKIALNKEWNLVNDWLVEEEFNPYFAWVSDDSVIKKDSCDGVRVIVRHEDVGTYMHVDMTEIGWRHAIPLTIEEIKKYSGGLL